MTRKQAISAIAKKKAEYCQRNPAEIEAMFINGCIGLFENTNSELEEIYEGLFQKSISIKK